MENEMLIARSYLENKYPTFFRTLAIVLAAAGVVIGIGVLWLGIILVIAGIAVFVFYIVNKKKHSANESQYHKAIKSYCRQVFPVEKYLDEVELIEDTEEAVFTTYAFSYEDDNHQRVIVRNLLDTCANSDKPILTHFLFCKEYLRIVTCSFSFLYGDNSEQQIDIRYADMLSCNYYDTKISYGEDKTAYVWEIVIATVDGTLTIPETYDLSPNAGDIVFRIKTRIGTNQKKKKS